MSSVIIDTDVLSFLWKNDTRSELYRPHLSEKIIVISFMTLAEIDRWALERKWGEVRKKKMEQHLKNFVVHPYNRELCLKWAEASWSAQRNGKPIETADAWIAATALLHNIPLVTNNKRHFVGVDGLTLITAE